MPRHSSFSNVQHDHSSGEWWKLRDPTMGPWDRDGGSKLCSICSRLWFSSLNCASLRKSRILFTKVYILCIKRSSNCVSMILYIYIIIYIPSKKAHILTMGCSKVTPDPTTTHMRKCPRQNVTHALQCDEHGMMRLCYSTSLCDASWSSISLMDPSPKSPWPFAYSQIPSSGNRHAFKRLFRQPLQGQVQESTLWRVS